MFDYNIGELIYANPLAKSSDIDGWRMEGDGTAVFSSGRMRMEGREGQSVHWCPEVFPDDISISWDFYPIQEPGLAIMFFSARGINGEHILSDQLAPRTGPYGQYNNGDINALHVSYFRRKHPAERAFTTCNLRKSKGFYLVAQGADPIPSIPDLIPPYRIEIVKSGPHVIFTVSQGEAKRLELFHWVDDGVTYGPVLGEGSIGLRQMTPLVAEYANIEVHRIQR